MKAANKGLALGGEEEELLEAFEGNLIKRLG